MNADGKVSLWVGTASSFEDLEAYILPTYTDDGDQVPSPFARDFALPRYEEGKREAEVFDEPRATVRSLLAGASYEDVVIPRFVERIGDTLDPPVNALVLLYDIAYDGKPRTCTSTKVRLRPVGVVAYR